MIKKGTISITDDITWYFFEDNRSYSIRNNKKIGITIKQLNFEPGEFLYTDIFV